MITKITVLVRNNSVHFVPEEPPSPNVPCGFLLVLLVLGLSLNACVFLSLTFASPKTFNRLLACFSFVVALEDAMNVTSSIVVRSSWEELYHLHGEGSVRFFCALNASCLQFVAVFEACLLAAMSYERWTSLKESNGGIKLKMVVPLAAVVSGVAALPIGLLATRHIEQRCSCSPVYVSLQPTHVLTASLTILIGYCLPSSIIFNSWITITKEIQKERRRIHNLELISRQSSPPVSFLHREDAATRTKIPPCTLAALLVIFYFVLVVPDIILVQATQFYTTYHVREDYLLFGVYRSNKTELPEELKPIETNAFDAVCIWARFSFTVVSPLLIILINEEVREQCKKWCRIFLDCVKQRKKLEEERRRTITADWTTPVLFATTEGLHLRKTQVPGTSTRENVLPAKFSFEFCDLFLEKLPQREVTEGRNLPPRVGCLVGENSLEEPRRAGPSRQGQGRISDMPSGVNKNEKFVAPNNELSSSHLLTLHQRMRKRDY